MDDRSQRFEALAAEVWGVARGCLANARRGEDRRLSLVQRVRRERLPEPPVPDDRVGAALARLRPADAEVLRLWAWEGLEPRDLAGCPVRQLARPVCVAEVGAPRSNICR